MNLTRRVADCAGLKIGQGLTRGLTSGHHLGRQADRIAGFFVRMVR